MGIESDKRCVIVSLLKDFDLSLFLHKKVLLIPGKVIVFFFMIVMVPMINI